MFTEESGSQENTWRHDSREAEVRTTRGVPNHSRDVKPVDDANDESRGVSAERLPSGKTGFSWTL